MIVVVRRRPDPLMVIAVATLTGAGVALLGLAARLALWGLIVPVAVSEHRHEHRTED